VAIRNIAVRKVEGGGQNWF